MVVVCLFGPDGSGKTTIARTIESVYRGRGVSIETVWMRGTHTMASIVARALGRLETLRGPCNPYYNICVPRGLRLFWRWLELFSLLPVALTRIGLPRALGRSIVAERSPPDLLVWLLLVLRDPGVLDSLVARIVFSVTRSLCDSLVYVRADLETLLSRRGGGETLSIELRVYDRLAEALGASVVDTSRKTVEESVREVMEVSGLGV